MVYLISALYSQTNNVLVASFRKLPKLRNISSRLSLWWSFVESGWIAGLLIDDVKIEVELVGINGIWRDNVVKMFPVIEQYVISCVQWENRFFYKSSECLHKFLLCHLFINSHSWRLLLFTQVKFKRNLYFNKLDIIIVQIIKFKFEIHKLIISLNK